MGKVKKSSPRKNNVPGVQNTQFTKKKNEKREKDKVNKALLNSINKSDLKKPNVSRKTAKYVLADTQYSKKEKQHDLRSERAAENAEKQSATSECPSKSKKREAPEEQMPANASHKIKRKQQEEQVPTETESKSKRKRENKKQDSNQANDTAPAPKRDKKLQKLKEPKETSDSRLSKTEDKNSKKLTEHKTNLNLSSTKKKKLSKKKMKQVDKEIRAKVPEVEQKNSAKIVTLNEYELNSDQLIEMLKPRNKQHKYRSSLPLREKMMAHLKSSRFRFINETLYTNHSSESKHYFEVDPEDFLAYHEGYKQQVQQWPVNPLNMIISSITSMPENNVIADFGCGEAMLAASVPHKVHSFDLVALSDTVQVCDMAHTSLLAKSVHVVVFCLSLMGTNLGDYIIEANRVLKKNGILKIAEVESRFDEVKDFITALNRYGFKNTWKDLSHNLFYFMDFTKEGDIRQKQNLPEIKLKPCLYKKR